jgi:Protein of unknown function (DUF2948)
MPDLNTGPLKLIALDDEDLGILSAHLQDAILRAGDIVYLARESRFALAARRFDWEGADLGLNRRRLSARSPGFAGSTSIPRPRRRH